MNVVKTCRVWGWRWELELDRIDPQSQMRFKGGGEGIPMTVWSVDAKLEG